MNPKERAQYLCKEMLWATEWNDTPKIQKENAKNCAIIAVKEIIKVCPYMSRKKKDTSDQFRSGDSSFKDYWQEVIKEIKKLK